MLPSLNEAQITVSNDRLSVFVRAERELQKLYARQVLSIHLEV